VLLPMKKSLLLLLAFGLMAIPAASNADSIVEEIVARVNNQIITRSEVQKEKDQLKQEVQQQDPSNASRLYAERERDVLRGLIDQDLLLDKGKDLGITADTDLIKRLDEIRKQMNLESIEDVGKAAEQQGVSFEDFKQNLKNQIITQKVIGQEVGQRLGQPTKEEEQKFYEEHKDEMKQPEQIRLSEILVSVQKPGATGQAAAEPTPEELAAAEAKAKSLLAEIKGGAKFEDVAKKNSDDTSAAQGGDLGVFRKDGTLHELENTLFSMKTGDVSDVIRTRQGFVILKVTEHMASGILPLKDVEPKIQEAIYMDKLQPALREYLTKLREDAFIYIKPGYIDTGASAKQTGPIETTIKEASAKNLKKKKKFGVF
jgi:peptidyl-prolyl cis-trans isomerase SurA